MISVPWKRRRRARHKGPPLRVVRAERDQARRRARELEWRLFRAEDALEHYRRESERLRARVAHLENALAASVPAPMDLPDMIWKPRPPRRPERSAKVVPLHQAPLGGRRA
jgi:hypothetical protein